MTNRAWPSPYVAVRAHRAMAPPAAPKATRPAGGSCSMSSGAVIGPVWPTVSDWLVDRVGL